MTISLKNRHSFLKMASPIISEPMFASVDFPINLEIEENEFQTILENSNQYAINPPATELSRLERLYDLTRMIYADHIADQGEKQLLGRLVIGLGFNTQEADA